MAMYAAEHAWTIPAAGETIAEKYQIEAECGRGGLAVVMTAVQIGLARRVAIKMLLPEWAGHPEAVERFLREGCAPARMHNEHVVRVFDMGTLETGAPYLVLEYLEGQNLEEVVAGCGPVHLPTAIDWILQVSEAIAEAHALGIVHRDLKPANLVLTRGSDGRACVKVIDFGLSKVTELSTSGPKLTQPTDVMGSPHYMAPEQLRAGYDTDTRTDIWALGAVLHEFITGQPPFPGESVPEVFAAVLTQPPPPLSSFRTDVPLEVEIAVLRCLQKDPEARFQTVEEFANALAPYAAPRAGASERVAAPVVSPRPALALAPVAGRAFPPLNAHKLNAPKSARFPSYPEETMSHSLYRRNPTDTEGPAFEVPASSNVVLPALLLMMAVAALAFMGLYLRVHRHDAERLARARSVTLAAEEATLAQPPQPAAVAYAAPPPPVVMESAPASPPKDVVIEKAEPRIVERAAKPAPQPRPVRPATATTTVRGPSPAGGAARHAAAPAPAGVGLAPWLAAPADDAPKPAAANAYDSTKGQGEAASDSPKAPPGEASDFPKGSATPPDAPKVPVQQNPYDNEF